MIRLIVLLALLLWAPALVLAEGIPGVSGPYPIFSTSAVVASDTAIKAGPGYVQFLVCIGADNSATAGTIALLDNTAAGGGTTVVTWTVQTTVNYSTPVIFPVQRAFVTGIYLDYTNAGDINCYVSYK